MKNKNQIFILLFSQLIIIACLDMVDPYWPLFIKYLAPKLSARHQAWWTILIYMAPYVMTILSAPVWAHIGKQFGYKKMVIRASLVLGTTQVLLFISHNLTVILFLRIFQGGFAGLTAAAQAWLICSTTKRHHGFYIGKVQSMIAVGSILGPILGGFISHFTSYRAIFIFSGVVCLFFALLLASFLKETKLQPSQKMKIINISKLRNIPPNCIFLFGLITFVQSLKWMSASFFAIYVTQSISGTNLTVGYLYAVIAVMIIIFSTYSGKMINKLTNNTLLLKRVLLSSLFISSISQLLYADSSALYLTIIASCIWGACQGIINTVPFSLLVQGAPPWNKGLIIGAGTSASKLGNLLGIALGGYIYATSGVQVAFIAIAVGYMLTFAFVLMKLESIYESLAN